MGAAPRENDSLKYEIEIVAGPHKGFKTSYSKSTVSIGRGPENDLVLSNDPRVSRNHAEIRQKSYNEFTIVNLSSKNFVMLNGENIQGQNITIVSGAVVQIGDSQIKFILDAMTPVVTPIKATDIASGQPSPQIAAVVSLNNNASKPVPSGQKPMSNSALPPGIVPRIQTPVMQPAPQIYPVGQYAGVSTEVPPMMGDPSVGASVRPASGGMNKRLRFYLIVGTLLGAFAWFMMSENAVKEDKNAIRNTSISMQAVVDAEKRSQELLTVKKEKYDSVQYRRAQENFIKAFRDFQQGQYARAQEAFQVVLNLDPENELAKRYYQLSKIKFDELVKFNMMQGNRYREKKNWRMCQSNYSNVMTMLQHRKDEQTYKEAKQFYDECSLNLEGRF